MKLFVKDKEFYSAMASAAIPVTLQQAITTGVNLTDNIMLGRLGEVQMSAATLANQFINIFFFCSMGLGMGATVLASRYWGVKAFGSLKKSVLLMYRAIAVVVVVFSLLTLLWPGKIMGFFSDETAVIEAGTAYFRISVPTYFLMGFSLTTSLILRSVGKANVPVLSSFFAFFVNVFANWVFIFGNLGAPCMEIRGAALGTLIARIFEFLFIMVYFLMMDQKIGFRLRDFLMKCGDIWPEYKKIGMPVFISDTLMGIGNCAVAGVMGHIGATFVAANSIMAVWQQLSTVVIQGVSQGGCVVIGNTLGTGEVKKAREQGVTMTVVSGGIGLVGCGLILALSDVVIGMYQVTEETRLLARELMQAVAVIVIFQCISSTLARGVLRGGGDTRFLMVADILFCGASAYHWESVPGSGGTGRDLQFICA